MGMPKYKSALPRSEGGPNCATSPTQTKEVIQSVTNTSRSVDMRACISAEVEGAAEHRGDTPHIRDPGRALSTAVRRGVSWRSSSQ